MRRILAAVLDALDPRGMAKLPRVVLAELLSSHQRTMTILVGRLVKAGFLSQPYGRWFVFQPSEELLQLSRELRGLSPRVDRKTLDQALAAFLDGRLRAGAPLRDDVDPTLAPFLYSHARTLSEKGALRGMDPLQLLRLMGEAYVLDTEGDAKLEANHYPLHPKWIRHAMPAIVKGIVHRLEAERKRAEARRVAREEAARAAAAAKPDRDLNRAAALHLVGALDALKGAT